MNKITNSTELNFVENLIKKGVSRDQSLEANQHVTITNSVSLIVTSLYLFYAFYGIYVEGIRTTFFALTFMLISLIAYAININGKTGVAKILIMGVTSFGVFFTYHIYTLSEAILTSYFPILLGYVFFFDFSEEKKHFLISFALTVVMILLCILLPRHLIYEIQVPSTLAQLSDKIHVIVALSVTSALLVVVIRNKDQVHRNLVAEKKKLESTVEELKETQSRLVNAEKMASLGQMSAGINHEIKNPLNFICGSLDTMKYGMNEEALKDNGPFIDIIEEGLQRIKKIVNSLSHFSHQSKEQEQCDIPELIDNCLNILEYQSKGRIKINKVYCDKKHILGNSGQLHQVFLNLLGNAMQAIPDKGRVSITTQKDESFIHIVISDDGGGIDTDILDKIFDPFFTTKKRGEGTGLGLAISSKIVSDHSGSIVATSDPGKGSTFRVSLPF